MATDGVLRGLGIMRPFLIANMVNLAIRLSVALIFAPRFGIAFVGLIFDIQKAWDTRSCILTLFSSISSCCCNLKIMVKY